MTDNSMQLSGKTALVTGASGGIGRVCAQMLAGQGADVIVHYHRNEAATTATVESLPSGSHTMLSADLRQAEEVSKLVGSSLELTGQLDILVNNAGVHIEHPPFDCDYGEWQDAWHKTITTNLIGPANLSWCAAQQMKQQGGGRIINVSSRGAFRGEPSGPAYGASKAGLNAFGQSLAKAVGGDNVFVFTVAPGFVETEMAAATLAGPRGDFLRGESPLGRVARPEDVAHTVLFLASPGSEFLTGCIVDVNGASYLRT